MAQRQRTSLLTQRFSQVRLCYGTAVDRYAKQSTIDVMSGLFRWQLWYVLQRPAFLGKVLSLRSVNVEPPQSSEPGNHLSLAPSRICQEEVSRLCSQPRLLSILNRPWTIWRPSRNMRSLCIDSLAEPVSLMSVSRISHWDNGITFKLIASVCEIPWENGWRAFIWVFEREVSWRFVTSKQY